MGGGAKVPPPDPNVGLAQKEMAAIAGRAEDRANRESLYFTENFAPRYLAQMDQQTAMAKQLQDYSLAQAQKYDQRYWDTTARQQDAFYRSVDQYDTAAERDRIGRAAGADVAQASQQGMQAMQRDMARRGVNPGSGAAIAAQADMQQDAILAKAGAMTMAQEAARREGLNLRGVASGLGGNLTGASMGYTGQALSAVPMGMQGISAANQGFAANNAQWNSTMGLASQNWNSVGDLGVRQYQAQVGAMAGKKNPLGAALGGALQGFATGGWWGAAAGAIGGYASAS